MKKFKLPKVLTDHKIDTVQKLYDEEIYNSFTKDYDYVKQGILKYRGEYEKQFPVVETRPRLAPTNSFNKTNNIDLHEHSWNGIPCYIPAKKPTVYSEEELAVITKFENIKNTAYGRFLFLNHFWNKYIGPDNELIQSGMEDCQYHRTSNNIVSKITECIFDDITSDSKIVVLYSIDFFEHLIYERGINPVQITFFTDNVLKRTVCKKIYGVESFIISQDEFLSEWSFRMPKCDKLIVIGNPPYQINNDKCGDTTHSSALYHKFVEVVIDNIKPDLFSFIIPSRWMIGGRGLDEHRERMMKDKRLKKIVHFNNPREVFPGAAISGGVNYFLWDKTYNGSCEFTSGDVTKFRNLDENDIILLDNGADDILKKIKSKTSKWMNKPWAIQSPFGVVSSFNEWKNEGVKCISVKQAINFISSNDFNDKNNIKDKWKVCTSKATSEGNITEDDSGTRSVATIFFIIEPGTICTQTYIVVNVFDDESSALNFIEYMKTKFFRFMLGLRVVTADVNKEKLAWVPDQEDYSTTYTDEFLYKQYNLTPEEIQHIETKIKAI